jgi:hypothetical protein
VALGGHVADDRRDEVDHAGGGQAFGP